MPAHILSSLHGGLRNALRLVYVIIILSSAASCSGDRITMFVGTYTGGDSEGIYVCKFDQCTGKIASPLICGAALPNPSYLKVTPDGKRLYAVSETADSAAALNAYAFDKVSGVLRPLSPPCPTLSQDPCYVDVCGSLAVTANYSGGNISVFRLEPSGGVSGNGPVRIHSGFTGGPDTLRQATPHAHCSIFSPDGRYLLMTDFSSDRILTFSVSADSLAFVSACVLAPNYGPRHIVFANNDSLAYVIGELSGTITAMKFDGGKLHPFQTVVCDTLHARGSADIRISPDNRFLYASNRLKGDGIAVFSITGDGSLTKKGYRDTGRHPRNIAITPNGKYLLAACKDDGTIQVFRRNKLTGELTYLPNDISLDSPVCIAFN